MIRQLAILCLIVLSIQLHGQDNSPKLSLDEVITLAKSNSIPAIRARHQYLVGHWRFRYFRSNYLPIVSLNTTPVDFNRTTTRRFNIEDTSEVFLPQRNIYSGANLSMSQRIGATGGSVFIKSELGRLQNFGKNSFSTYTVTPLQIGLNQPLFAFNEQKWEKIMEPLAFDLAKKTYISDMEAVSIQALTYFFDLASAQNDFELAVSNKAIADTLLGIAKERLELGTLTQDDVLELELRMLDAETSTDNSTIALQKARGALNLFLGLVPNQKTVLRIPERTIQIQLDPDLAIYLALENHPKILQGKFDQLNADQEADKTNKENRFNAEISASIGLNQSSETIAMAFGDLLDQEQVRISLSIPLLDWGRREGRYKMAQSQREVIQAEVSQSRVDFEQEVRIQVAGFLMKDSQINYALRGKELAQRRYEITRQRFLFGNVDLIKLTGAIQAKNQAEQQYLQAVKEFWLSYYTLRELTLFDFEKQENIEVNFGQLLNQ